MAMTDQAATPASATTARPARRDRLGIPALVLAMSVSNAGNNLTAIAIPWFVLATTGSAARTGVVAAVGLAPGIITGWLGGAYVDRLGFKRSSIIADLLSGVSVALIPTLFLLDVLQFWQLLALVFIGAAFDSPGWTAREALLPQLAERAGTQLERANASYQIAQFGASVVGPLVAGVLIAAMSASSVLYFDAASFAFSAAIVALAIYAPRAQRDAQPSHDEAKRTSPFAEAWEAIRWAASKRLIVIMLLMAVLANFLFSPLIAVVFPVYAKRVFGDPEALGFLVASFGVGSVVSALGYAALGPRLRRTPAFIGGLAIIVVGLWILPLSNSLPLSVVAGMIAGLGIGPLNILAMTLVQERTPEAMLGRVLGALGSATQVASPLGVLLAGVAIEWAGVRGVMAVVAAGFTVVTLFIALHPVVRTMDDPIGEQAPA